VATLGTVVVKSRPSGTSVSRSLSSMTSAAGGGVMTTFAPHEEYLVSMTSFQV
jgi:hypothetical protein